MQRWGVGVPVAARLDQRPVEDVDVAQHGIIGSCRGSAVERTPGVGEVAQAELPAGLA